MSTIMEDNKKIEIISNVRKRYAKETHDNRTVILKDDLILFLANEVDQYRDKINRLEIELNKKVKQLEEKAAETTLEAIKENTVAEIIKAFSDNGFNNISISIFKAEEEKDNAE